MRRHLFLLLSGIFLWGCQEPAAPTEEQINAEVGNTAPPPIEVAVTDSRRQTFALTRTLSGKLEAARQMRVFSELAGTIDSLPVREGSYVPAGALIAGLNQEALRLERAEANLALDRAKVEKMDGIIANGGDPDVDTSISAERLDMILTLSGYREAQQRLARIDYRLDKSRITAPYGGLIADLQVRRYEQIGPGTELCRLIDPGSFEAVFLLLEREALQLRAGQSVTVRPLSPEQPGIRARITTINPTVSEEGLVKVRAALSTHQQQLFEGMNVQVTIEQRIPNQIVVPAEAVVMRSGRPVVFVYHEAEQRAKWNYVTIAHRNETHVALSEGIDPGVPVIVEGNLTLSHDARVTIENDE